MKFEQPLDNIIAGLPSYERMQSIVKEQRGVLRELMGYLPETTQFSPNAAPREYEPVKVFGKAPKTLPMYAGLG